MRCCAVKGGVVARFGAGLLIALTVSAALPQDPVLKHRTKEEREEQFNATHRITMNVQVTDAAGNAVSDLRAEDFSLYDNQQVRRIGAFHSIDGAALNDATTIVIVLDAVNTPAEALQEQRNAIFRYLAESRKPLPFRTAFALWFNGHLSATPATTDRDVIGRAFVKLTKNVHSNACGSEQDAGRQQVAMSKGEAHVDPATCRAVHFKDSVSALAGIAQGQLTTGGRTLLIWMGAGWPALSNAEFQRLSSKQHREYAREFVTVLHDLRAAQMTVYSLGSGMEKAEGDATGAGRLAIAKASGPQASPQIVVDEFARRTGGRVIASSTDLLRDLSACIRDAEWYYSLSFNVPPARNGAEEIHSLELKVNRPGVAVRTMDSYYSEP